MRGHQLNHLCPTHFSSASRPFCTPTRATLPLHFHLFPCSDRAVMRARALSLSLFSLLYPLSAQLPFAVPRSTVGDLPLATDTGQLLNRTDFGRPLLLPPERSVPVSEATAAAAAVHFGSIWGRPEEGCCCCCCCCCSSLCSSSSPPPADAADPNDSASGRGSCHRHGQVPPPRANGSTSPCPIPRPHPPPHPHPHPHPHSCRHHRGRRGAAAAGTPPVGAPPGSVPPTTRPMRPLT